MANSKQAIKRIRQNEKRRAHNHSIKSTVRTALKKVLAAIRDNNKESANKSFREFQSLGDKAAKKRIFSPNKINRHKRRLNSKIKAI